MEKALGLLLLACIAVLAGFVWSLGPRASANSAGSAEKAKSDVGTVVKGGNQFGWELYSRLSAENGGNLFFSPESIHSALAMTYVGARGQTADQMAKVLHFTLPLEQLNPAFGTLVRTFNLPDSQRKYELAVANALWGQKGSPLRKEFLEVIKDTYDAGMNQVDFQTATEQARQTINAWVEKQTKEKIKDLIPAGVLQTSTQLVLTNAIYFKGAWADKFKADATKEEPFDIGLKEAAQPKVPMMHRTADYNLMIGGDFKAAELPYVGDELSMIVLLPDQPAGLAKLEKSLTESNVAQWLGSLRQEQVDLALPKFTMTKAFRMGQVLRTMGMAEAFSDRADFSGMISGKRLEISEVVHKAFVDVNEEGTEAAAATGVGMRTLAMRVPRPPIVFHADHPFVFIIRHKPTGAILFIGRVTNPAAG